MNFQITQAEFLAKQSLDKRLLAFFIEARVLGKGKDKKLFFFFKKEIALLLFEKQKEKILQKLRKLYREKLELYRKENFIFYGIEAKNARDKERLDCLEKGIARLESILKKGKEK